MNSLNRRTSLIMIAILLYVYVSDFSLVFGNDFSYDSHGKKDPFMSPASDQGSNAQFFYGELKLEGIVVDNKGQSYAIVNGEVVREGQKFQGFLLKEITAQDATFQRDEEVFKVQLRRDDELIEQYLNQDNNN